MAKRFTATEKWDDPWFCALAIKEQLFWIYLLDKCNHAGIWQVHWTLVTFYIPGFIYRPASFEGRILEISASKWFIPKFIQFQYGELNPANRAHASVLLLLEKEGASMGLASPVLGHKDKDKDMDKDKVKVKDVVSKPEKSRHLDFVWLTSGEYDKLRATTGNLTQGFIERLNGYIGQIGEAKARAKYTSHYHTILNWYRKDKAEGKYHGTNGGTGISEYAAIAKRAREAMGIREPITPPRALSPGFRNLSDVQAEAAPDIGSGERGDVRAMEIIRGAGIKIEPAGSEATS